MSEPDVEVAPLLSEDDGCQSNVDPRRCRWSGVVAEWWAVTTNPEYLVSAASRRTFRSTIFPLLWVLASWDDYVAGRYDSAWRTSFLVLCIVGTILGSQVSPQFLYGDFVMALFMFGYNLGLLGCHNPPALYDTIVFGGIGGLGVVGTHSAAIFAYGLMLVVFYGFHDMSVVAEVALQCVAAMALFLPTELWVARLCKAHHESRIAMQQLLDMASDGFCSVDLKTGAVTACSDGLHRTIGCGALPGKMLANWAEGDDRSSLLEILRLAALGEELRPVLITCRVNGAAEESRSVATQFDARIIPYAMADSSLSISVQVQGEIRAQELADARAVVNTRDEASEVTDLDNDSVFELLGHAAVKPKHRAALLSVTSSSLALSISNASVPTRVQCISRAAQTDVEHFGLRTDRAAGTKQTDQATGTTIVWAKDGFTCMRCAKPPRPDQSDAPRGQEVARREVAAAASSSRSSRSARSSSRRSARSSSSSSAAAEAEARDVVPLLGHFSVTPAMTAAAGLMRALKRWNPPRGASPCCPLHGQVQVASQLLAAAAKQRCNPLWSPHVDWQCPSCLGLACTEDEACQICGEANSSALPPAEVPSPEVRPSEVPLVESEEGSAQQPEAMAESRRQISAQAPELPQLLPPAAVASELVMDVATLSSPSKT